MKIINIPCRKRFNSLERCSSLEQIKRLAVCTLSALAISFGSLSNAYADYKDPLESEVLPMASAAQSLLLDIARAGDRLVAVGERGHILYSDDQGSNWTLSQVPVRSQLNAVFFADDQLGWAVGEDAVILHTSDGGLSWQKQFDARDADLKGPLLDIYFISATEGLAIGVFNKLYHTQNGGKSWEIWQEHADNLDEWHLFSMASPAPGVIYVTSESGLLFLSQDGGNSFIQQQTDHDGSFHGVLAMRGADGLDRLLLSGVGGKLFISPDSGNSWRELDSHTEAGLSGGSWLPDGSALIVGADGVMLRISPDLSSVEKFQRDNGLPLSNVITTENDGLVLVGLGGIQTLQVGEVTQHD
ncbi:MAG: YCF48-related protein [Amphritea sp.]